MLSPREIATGSPSGDALDNINTNPVADGALCYVKSGAQGLWELEKTATDAADGTTIVAPSAGPGRWFLKLGPGPVTGGFPIATIQNIAVAGPTTITDTFNTLARVDTATIAAASDVTLPAGEVGKQITVKDSSGSAGANNITITPDSGTIDGAATQTIAVNRGAFIMICSSIAPDVWDIV